MHKIKGLYFYGYDNAEAKFRNFGVEKKVEAQIKAINQSGISCRQIKYQKPFAMSIWRKIIMRLPFQGPIGDCLSKHRPEFDGFDFYYIRRPVFLSLPHLLSIRKIRKHNPNAVILYELWTYPFKKELTSRLFDYPLWWKEVCYMPFLKRYINRYVTVSNHNKISGVTTIKMANGIDFDLISPINPLPSDDAIHIIAVAKISVWHGYDRFLQGMYRYYKSGGKQKIVLHIVGTGFGQQKLNEMIKEMNLNENVVMHGFKTGAELDAIYNKCHLGLISLATQEKGIYVHSTLKSREYLAKGLPTMATGMTDVFINTDYKYNLELPTDEKTIDMNRIIVFYNQVYKSATRQQVITEIREFAERTIAIQTTMKPIIQYIKGTVNFYK
ncbi:glycosyltransferase [uncultured Muribaculum sp.]|uniref:glycosyltransferase n=1 Tax=uncultured Muribaculum sp. TaxID=1918613 RepID=UPI0026761FAA|nr:glycosyltransferase [uncultured Muribaculum sp.]